jgi:hypothetical protein
MKQKDILTIVAAVIASVIVSLLVSSKVFAPPKDRMQQVEVIPSISSNFNLPDSKYFNSGSIDPTQLIQIGGNNTSNPFSASQ